MRTRWLHLAVAIAAGAAAALAAVSPAAPAPAPAYALQERDADAEAKIKSAFILNFLRYTTWPDAAFDDTQSSFVVGVLGDASVETYVRRLTADERIRNRPVQVVELALPQPSGDVEADRRQWDAFVQQAAKCQAVFIGRASGERSRALINALREQPVLTIGDQPGFAEARGMLGFAVRDNRMQFDANPEAIRRAGLEVSSRILKLARIVTEEES
jgi:hypothetical protein